jgi:chromosome segregation ATPase
MVQLVAFQAIPSLQKDGIPYWIFWGMLLVILLLFLFIFLRDRKLRLRLSAFFAGARKRSVILQLRYKLRKERQKKENALKRLGEKAWDGDFPLEDAQAVRAALEEMVKKRDAAQMEWKNAFTEMEGLHKRLEELDALFAQKLRERHAQKQPFDELLKRKREEERALRKQLPGRDIDRQVEEVKIERAETAGRVEEFESEIKDIEAEHRHHQREVAREMQIWKKKKEKVQEHIKEIEAQQGDLYLSLGRILEEKKVESPELHGLYAEIDLINDRIGTLNHRIGTLGGG